MIKKIEAEIERLTAELETIDMSALDDAITDLEQQTGVLVMERSDKITKKMNLEKEIEFFEKAIYKIENIREEI